VESGGKGDGSSGGIDRQRPRPTGDHQPRREASVGDGGPAEQQAPRTRCVSGRGRPAASSTPPPPPPRRRSDVSRSARARKWGRGTVDGVAAERKSGWGVEPQQTRRATWPPSRLPLITAAAAQMQPSAARQGDAQPPPGHQRSGCLGPSRSSLEAVTAAREARPATPRSTGRKKDRDK